MMPQQPGVLVFGGDIVCYELSGAGLRARALGEVELLPVTAALEAAIRSDLDHQRAKLQTQGDEVAEVAPEARSMSGSFTTYEAVGRSTESSSPSYS